MTSSSQVQVFFESRKIAKEVRKGEHNGQKGKTGG